MNYPIVFECYSDIKIKCFVYHPYATDWKKTIAWHSSRHPRPIYAWGDVREVNHLSNFQDSLHFMKVPDQLINLGVDPDKILYIGNHHAMVDDNDVRIWTKSKMHSIFLRYFEFDTVTRHTPVSEHRDHWQTFKKVSPSIPKKKYLCLFGKPRKFMRIGAMIKLVEHEMHHDAWISSLVSGQGISQSIKLAEKYWPRETVQQVLEKFQGSIDDIEIDAPQTSESNYRGYPYDPSLYQNTDISIIAETNDVYQDKIPTMNQFFITEKTARPMYNKHPFVILSTRNFLSNLKYLGYETFNTVIDESYDHIEDPYQRLDKALAAAESLSKQAQSSAVRKICNYNFDHLHTVFAQEKHKLIQLLLNMASK